jgi:hypothetical protein
MVFTDICLIWLHFIANIFKIHMLKFFTLSVRREDYFVKLSCICTTGQSGVHIRGLERSAAARLQALLLRPPQALLQSGRGSAMTHFP